MYSISAILTPSLLDCCCVLFILLNLCVGHVFLPPILIIAIDPDPLTGGYSDDVHPDVVLLSQGSRCFLMLLVMLAPPSCRAGMG